MMLWSLFLNHPGRIAHKWKHYFPVYEKHFSRYINRPVVMFEIGCGEGGSLQLWKQYLGPLATIVGLDIRPECKAFEEDQIQVRIGDQSNPDFLGTVLREFGPPDIVLDDGSHITKHVVASFQFLYPHVTRDGIYFVEDLQTAYWDEFGGGHKRPGTFIELCKDLMDELNAQYSRGSVQESDFSKTTLSMSMYNALAVFEKGSIGHTFNIQLGQGKESLTVTQPPLVG
ncbi:class I SAM-dependent methyltransferase [Phyllobacterium sp. 628]|uniref:class I SAM-dependent methyltransferase n=1 Tax=Phyllobacterium sp. 628 TaxID=2718938 RepID=UPI0016628607|nr:class I SAM-dependent methyltransferase [Phyllobacterium sp. 628]QND51909.1 class I SAM-dependent methyltransferase [Phyllobacterium sp. 628]